MRLLIMIRHGDYDKNLRLSSEGRSQMLAIAEVLKPYLSGKAFLLSSSADRARESAEVFTEAINIPMEVHEVLWSQGSHPEDLPAALELIRAHEDIDVLFLMTHLEYVNRLPQYFFRIKLEADLPWSVRINVERGQASIIDCENKTYTEVK